MTTYQVQIDDTSPLGKSIVALLQSASDAVKFTTVKTKEKNAVYKRVEHGFRDVREMLDGRQQKVAIDEFLNEL